MAKKKARVKKKIDPAAIYTPRQAAACSNVSERRIRKLCEEGKLGRKAGSATTWIITGRELIDYLKQS